MIRRFYHWVIATSLLAAAGAAEAPSRPEVALLERAGQRVQQFWDELSSVACTENAIQEKFNEKGKLVLSSRSAYDYLMSLRWSGGELLIDESRLPINDARKKPPEGALLATRGFATLMLVLHPEFQPSYLFTILPDEESSGRKMARVSFVPRDGGRSPAVLELKGREYPIAWEGTAWMDAASGTIERIQAHWKKPDEKIGLEMLASDVHYGPVTLRGKNYWLPDTAAIEVKTRHQHWRNSHQFTKYRLFSVEADDKVETKQ